MRMTPGDRIFYPFMAALVGLLGDDYVLCDHYNEHDWHCLTNVTTGRAVTIKRTPFDTEIDYIDAAGNLQFYKIREPKVAIIELLNFLSGKEPVIK